jgi:PAS domain-containing protein
MNVFLNLSAGLPLRNRISLSLTSLTYSKISSNISPLNIVYQLDPEGVILWFGSAVEVYGYAPEELTGRIILDIIHPTTGSASASIS